MTSCIFVHRLHDDLNRVKSKPEAVEDVNGDGTNDAQIAELQWKNYQLR